MSSLPTPDFSRLAPREGFRLLVTGGCGGIGKALVSAAVKEGLEVVVMDLPQSLERHPLPDGVQKIAWDVTDDSAAGPAFAALDKHWGALDGMVHLPGFMNRAVSVEELSMAEIDETLNVNLRSAFVAARQALPLLRKGEAGSMVFAASGLATLVEKGTNVYSASKAGIIALSKGLAKECAPDIRSNCIAPGAVDTAFLRGGTGRGGEDRNADDTAGTLDHQRILATVPAGRIAVVEDIVGPILFLLSEKARFMTGQTLYINGGRFMV